MQLLVDIRRSDVIKRVIATLNIMLTVQDAMNQLREVAESIKSGTVASLAMMPVGFAFKEFGLRVGHYGPKFAGLFVDEPTRVFMFSQHIVIGWVSALPLIVFLYRSRKKASPILIGAIYGVLYYLVLNFTALPMFFADPFPMQLGILYIVPSLVVHIVFGAVVGMYYQVFSKKAEYVAG